MMELNKYQLPKRKEKLRTANIHVRVMPCVLEKLHLDMQKTGLKKSEYIEFLIRNAVFTEVPRAAAAPE